MLPSKIPNYSDPSMVRNKSAFFCIYVVLFAYWFDCDLYSHICQILTIEIYGSLINV